MNNKYKYLLLGFLLVPLLGTSQILQVTYDHLSQNGAVKSEGTLLLTEEKAQYIRDFNGQTVEVDGITIKQQPDRYVVNMSPKIKKFKEFRTYKDHLFTADWDYDQDWTITKETDTILDLPVVKAYKTENPDFGKTFVWFTTTDIPVSAGPIRYAGLPGLILKVAWEKNDYEIIASNIEIIEDNNRFIEYDKENAIPLDKEEIKYFEEHTLNKKIKQYKK